MSFLSRIAPRWVSGIFESPSQAQISSTPPSNWGVSSRFSFPSFPIHTNPGSTMDKTKKIALFLLIGTFFATSLGLYATEKKKAAQPLVFSKIEGATWVKKCTEQYPEILWLADEKVKKTEEGSASAKAPYSEQLFGKVYPEFDRTLMTLHCLRLILDGSEKAYQQFTDAQPSGVKLSKESFNKLHSEGMSLVKLGYDGLDPEEMVQAMEAALVLGDIGKSEKARSVFTPYGAHAPDHDDFHGEVLQILKQNPELSPTFKKLPFAAQHLLIQTANLIHYGHVTHLEGGPNMFNRLYESGLAASFPTAVGFDFFVHTCDVAGALGHVNHHSSLVYSELTHKAMQAVAEASSVLVNAEKTPTDAYNAYLAIRASWLGLDPSNRADRALTRMGAMLRLFTPEEGALLKKAMAQLDPQLQMQIVEQLDVREGEELARTPTYMPAVLVNLSNNEQLGNTREERISQAVILGLPFLSRVLEQHQQALAENKADPEIPLNFNKAAAVAKSAPKTLLNEFRIDREGTVEIR